MHSPPTASDWVHRTPRGTEMVQADGSLRRSLSLLLFLAAHEFRLRYRAQALGVFWSVLYPLVMMLVLVVVLSRKLGTGQNYPIHLLIGLVIWTFVGGSTQSAVGSLVARSEIVRRAMVPREILPLATMLSYSVNLALESIVLVAFVPIFPGAFRLSPALLLLPLILAALFATLWGFAKTMSALNVIYRDVGYIVTTSLLIGFWLTPVVYTFDDVADPYRRWLLLNPVGVAMQAARDVLMLGRAPSSSAWAVLVISAVASLAIGRIAFRKLERVVLDCI